MFLRGRLGRSLRTYSWLESESVPLLLPNISVELSGLSKIMLSSSSESEAERLSPRLGSDTHGHPYGMGTGAMLWYCRTSKGRYLKIKVAIFRMLETSVEEKGVADDKGDPSSRR